MAGKTYGGTGNTGYEWPVNWQARMPAPPAALAELTLPPHLEDCARFST